jgi:hypothetical protein
MRWPRASSKPRAAKKKARRRPGTPRDFVIGGGRGDTTESICGKAANGVTLQLAQPARAVLRCSASRIAVRARKKKRR